MMGEEEGSQKIDQGHSLTAGDADDFTGLNLLQLTIDQDTQRAAGINPLAQPAEPCRALLQGNFFAGQETASFNCLDQIGKLMIELSVIRTAESREVIIQPLQDQRQQLVTIKWTISNSSQTAGSLAKLGVDRGNRRSGEIGRHVDTDADDHAVVTAGSTFH